MEISCRGLRQILIAFNNNGRRVDRTHWSIARGGYDLWWQLYYDNIPIVDCVSGRLENDFGLSDKLFNKIKKIIISEYPECK